LKTGNRDLFGSDFHWLIADQFKNKQYPKDLMVIERREWGNFYGYLVAVKENGKVISEGKAAWNELQKRLKRTLKIYGWIREIEKSKIGSINASLENLRLDKRRLELDHDNDPKKLAAIETQKAALLARSEKFNKKLRQLYFAMNRDSLTAKVMDGRVADIPLAKIVHAYRPNAMSLMDKIQFYGMKIWEFLSDDPREANTEGGIFPAIFGTVIMVILMSIIVTPIGVIAAIYLHEYAKQGWLTRTIRIAVNNLAGVPSIVYGVFGLGFFVYFVGSNIDEWFFSTALPAPTFGTPGILWASLTLALLTVPVVIVSTEEGLSRIPRSIREGSLALGATKAETLWRTVLPMASPAMMTGLILAISRAAGEVAPLMLVGVVKLAPSLAVDAQAPFLHLDRQFMHLGFHIYDVGFQSPNVEAGRPLVYATAFLLVAVIIMLNLAAIWIRNNLREKYKALETA
jgi:phosphate transport system permease protein